MGWAQVENKTESTIEGEKAKLTCPMSKSSEAPQDQGNLLRGIVDGSDVARSLVQKTWSPLDSKCQVLAIFFLYFNLKQKSVFTNNVGQEWFPFRN